jgi:ribonuclease VapC
MFVDAAALVAILSDEAEAGRCSKAVVDASECFTSAVAVWEAVMALARRDKLGLPMQTSERFVLDFLNERGIEIRDLPPPHTSVSYSLDAARRFRTGPFKLNLADCFHYACARHYEVPVLSTADEFRLTDLLTVP